MVTSQQIIADEARAAIIAALNSDDPNRVENAVSAMCHACARCPGGMAAVSMTSQRIAEDAEAHQRLLAAWKLPPIIP